MSVPGRMIAGCLVSVIAAALVIDPDSRTAVVAGMAGPLVSACGTWVMIERTLRRQPALLMRRLLVAFFVKVVLFVSYVVVAVKGLDLALEPFAISFAAYFIVLHQIEALLLRRRTAHAFHA